MRRKFFKKFLTYLILMIIYISLAEVTLSLFDPERVFVKSFDDKLLFSMYPNKNGIVISEEYKVSVETNDFGGRQKLNDSPYPILLLGDSFSEGWGVEEEENFTTVSNKLLSKDLQIRNMGVHGSSPSLMYLHLVQYVDHFKPKKVYLQLFDNDLDDLEKFEQFIVYENGKPKPKKPMMVRFLGESIYNSIKESSIFRLGKRVLKFSKGGVEPILYYKNGREPQINLLTHLQSIEKFGHLKPLGQEINSKYNGQFEFYSKSEDTKWKSNIEKESIYLNLIFDFLNERKIELGLIYIPAKEFFATGGILGNEKMQNISQFEANNAHYKNIKSFCDLKSLSCLMGTDLLWKHNPEELYFPYDAHWNRKGHELFGKIFASEIQKSFRNK